MKGELIHIECYIKEFKMIIIMAVFSRESRFVKHLF